MSETGSTRIALALGLIAVILGAANLAFVLQLSGQVSNVAKQVEVVVGNQRLIMQEPHVAAFMAAYREKGQIVIDAQKEGKVMFYFGYATEKGASMLDAFKKKYPFIETEFYRIGALALFERYDLEYKAGKYLADVAITGEVAMLMFKENGYLARAIPELPEAKAYPDKAKDPDGYYCGRDIHVLSPIVNTKILPNEALWPKDWTDFADPKPEWIGQLGMGDFRIMSSAYTVVYGMYHKFGRNTWASIAKGLAKAKPTLQTSSAGIVRQTLSGETPLVLYSIDYNTLGEQMKGAPLKILLMKSGSIAYFMTVAVLAKAPHPNAARLFADFALSKEMAEIHVQSGELVYPARPDVKILPIVPTLEQHNPIYVTGDVMKKAFQEQEAITAEMLQLMEFK